MSEITEIFTDININKVFVGDHSKIIYRDDQEDKCYIYWLFDAFMHLLYIGQAQNVHSRFKTHLKNFSELYVCKYFKVDSEKADETEFELICKLLPKLNKNLPRNNKYCTLDDYQGKDNRFYTQRVQVYRLIEKFNIKNIREYYLISDLNIISENFGGE